MARLGVTPVPNNPMQACTAVEAHLAVVLRGQSLAEAGWQRPDPLVLLVPLLGIQADGTEDDYLLRLHFGYYPEWPPSAQFVNPTTKEYHFPDDVGFLPRIEGTSEIQVHNAYGSIGQLICCSVTLEFYLVSHGAEARHVWDPEHQNFAATLNAIKRGLRPPYYKGRMT